MAAAGCAEPAHSAPIAPSACELPAGLANQHGGRRALRPQCRGRSPAYFGGALRTELVGEIEEVAGGDIERRLGGYLNYAIRPPFQRPWHVRRAQAHGGGRL